MKEYEVGKVEPSDLGIVTLGVYLGCIDMCICLDISLKLGLR